MSSPHASDESLVHRLPLPLAQLYRRAHNAKTAQDRHLTAYYLWEAALKLLASVAVVEYAERGEPDPQLAERLTSLARPSLGHWWEFVRLLVPALAERGDEGFAKVRDLLLGRTRDDLPRAAGLDAALREVLEGKGGARSTVRLSELFDRLVRYRNREVGHGAVGRQPDSHYERLGWAMLGGVAEVLGRLDVLAGRRLVYVADVRRQTSGAWLVERYELIGESARRIESLELPESDQVSRLLPGRINLSSEMTGLSPQAPGQGLGSISLHPLAVYDADAAEMLFLNARRGRQRTEYLCYSSGRVIDRPDLGGEQRQLLARILGSSVDEGRAGQWAAQSQAEEQAESPAPEWLTEPQARRVGEFELWSELGRGGMGVVYRAWQPSLGRQVALKAMLKPGDAKAEARFAREIRALGKVEHGHLVKIFTCGAEADQWFYAMELVEGATLAAVCDRLTADSSGAADVDLDTWRALVHTVCEESRQAEKTLSKPGAGTAPPAAGMATPGGKEVQAGTKAPAETLESVKTSPGPRLGSRGYVRHMVDLMQQVAEAAHALHEGGIIHRDVKPGNVIVSSDGSQAVLMDLGLAQLADDVEGRLTRTRQFVGTLRYASPEQVLAVGRLDRRSDVYSLGATLWELLTLRPLYGATEQTPAPELMQRIQFDEPARLHKDPLGIPKDLEAIVLKCLEKRADRRYATAKELAGDLGLFLKGEPVQARPVHGWERGLKWVKRRPALAALAGTAFLLVLSLLGWMFYAWREAEAGRAAEARRVTEEAEHRRVVEQQLYFNRVALAGRELSAGKPTWAAEQLDLCPIEMRQWEWNYLRRRVEGATERVLEGHDGGVSCVAVSPDGLRIVSSGGDGSVRLWDADTGKAGKVLTGHRGSVNWVAFSPDGESLASAGEDGRVILWDARSGDRRKELAAPAGPLSCVAFHPSGRELASATFGGDGPGEVRIWRVDSGQTLHTLDGHTGRVTGLAYSPDGDVLATASHDQTVRLWDGRTGEERLVFRGHDMPVAALAFSPNGLTLVSAGGRVQADQPEEGEILLWSAKTGQVERRLHGHTGRPVAVAFSPDGRRLATGGWDREVKLWDVASGSELLSLPGHQHAVMGVVFGGGGRYLVSGSLDRTVRIWDGSP